MAATHQERYTYADYLTWDDDVRRELIDGEIFVMSPAPARNHQVVAGGIFSQLNERLLDSGGPCQAFIAPFDVRLPADGQSDAETVVQPDLMVICDATKLDRRGAQGSPDLVVEVISPSTAGHDLITKRALYERHGVPEYWLVHPVDRIVTIYRLDEKGRYGKPEVSECKGSSPVVGLPGIDVDWDRVFLRVPREV